MSYIGATEIGKMFLGDVEIDKAYLGNDLVFSGDSSLPYTPVNYIITDGVAYINTRLAGSTTMACEMKVLMGSNVTCGLLGGFTNNSPSAKNTYNFSLVLYYDQKRVGFTHAYNYVPSDGIPSVDYSVTNTKPFVVKSHVAKGNQQISVLQENSSSWTTFKKTNKDTVNAGYPLVILNVYVSGGYNWNAPSGTRLYYCKIYNDVTYTNLVFNGIPVLYNGNYGLWDLVSNSFFGNAAASGSFSGQ